MTDGVDADRYLDIATDGGSRWIAVWSSDTMLGGTIGADADILYSVSTDGGLTWAAPAALNTDATSDIRQDRHSQIEYDGAGTWVVVWSGSGLNVARSVDEGNSWSAPVSIDATIALDVEMEVAGTTAIVVVRTNDDFGGTIGEDDDLILYRSGDSGGTWSTASVLNSTAVGDQVDQEDIQPSLATDGTGNWIAVWEREDSGASLLQQAVSIDDGVSWSATSNLSALVGGLDDEAPAIAADALGRWIVTWRSDDNPAFLLPAAGGDILFAISDDVGTNWTQAAFVNSTALSPRDSLARSPAIANDGAGTWSVVWQEVGLSSPYKSGRSDADLFGTYSVDNGATWGEAAVRNSDGANDDNRSDHEPLLEFDGAGTWLTAWSTAVGAANAPGEDFDFLFARAVDTCPTTPAPGCIGTTTPGRSRIKLSNKPGQRGKLQWKTSRVQETVPADLGDPTASSSFVLCIYDGRSGGDRLVYERPLVAGATCGGSPCWKAVSGGYSYRDRKLDNGPIKKMQIQTGADGEAKYQIVAKGEKLGLPAMPFELASPLRAQLISQDSGTCWDAAFGAPDENSADAFKGRSD